MTRNAPSSSISSGTSSGDSAADALRPWIVLALVLLLIKFGLASGLDLFGDEAFYRWESRHPAAGYSDVPALTPWLVRLGTDLAGGAPLGIRWPFLLLGGLLPWLVYRMSRLVLGRHDAGIAAALSLCLPLAALAGVLALPDVPLTCAMLGSLYFLARLLRRGRWRDAIALGACLAIGWLSHYRFALIYLVGIVYLEFANGAGGLRRSPKFWVAQALGLLGLVPTLWYNLVHAFAAVRFQFVERHPWSFHADGLGEVFVQAGVTTPLMFGLLVLAGIETCRRTGRSVTGRAAVAELYAFASLVLLGGYLVLDCFADAARLRLHWPMPAYLFALPLLPPFLRRLREQGGWRRALAFAVPGTGALGVALSLAWMANAARPVAELDGSAGRYVPDHQTGWSELTAWAAEQRAALGPATTPIAGDFLVGAEWAYALGDADEPYVLRSPMNHKHGRAGQLETFGRDEQALYHSGWTRGLLLVDDTAVRPIEVLPAYRALCPRFGRVEYRGELAQRGGRSRFLAFSVEPGRDADKDGRCALPPLAYVDEPSPNAEVSGPSARVRGWAFAEHLGVARVEVLVDGKALAEASYGLAAPQVRGQWPMSEDPGHPDVGFEATVPLSDVALGTHRLSLRVTDRDGRQRELARQPIHIR